MNNNDYDHNGWYCNSKRRICSVDHNNADECDTRSDHDEVDDYDINIDDKTMFMIIFKMER